MIESVSTHPYDRLDPDTILDAVDSAGFTSSGMLLALNSYENRVYQVGIEDAAPLVVKFYRPDRWTRAQILEEHEFALELAEHEIPMVAPLADAGGNTLFAHAGFSFALFPRRGGRAPDLEDPEGLSWIGRFLGRIHALGAARGFEHRVRLDSELLGHGPRAAVLESGMLPGELVPRYEEVSALLLEGVERAFVRAEGLTWQRIHGDCHPGNILWTDAGPHFVDLDDCMMGPAVQDIWMLLAGERRDMQIQLADVLEGYTQFHDFDARGLLLVEALRSLRLVHYAGWLARRWDDPAFPRNFPWFATPRYWEEHIQTLREQVPLLDEPPLQIL